MTQSSPATEVLLGGRHLFDSGSMKCVQCGADYFKVRDGSQVCPATGGDAVAGEMNTKAQKEMLALADKIEFAVKTEGEITLFQTNGTRAVYALRRLAEVSGDAAATPADWQDDPSSDERWNAGVDYALEMLCDYLGVEPGDVTWDAATEAVDGDINAVIGNILRTKFGEDWGPNDPAQSAPDRAAIIEECAKVAEAEKETFLSPQYASNQPFGSLCERFACDEVAKAIRALAVPSPNRSGAT